MIKFRTYYSIQHLKSAYLLLLESNKIESEYNGKFDDDLHSRNSAYVISSIFSSLSFLEAVINEIICDIVENESRVNTLSSIKCAIIKEKWISGNLDKRYILKKYQYILNVLEVQPFDMKSDLIDNLETMIPGFPKTHNETIEFCLSNY